jgi:hypothetical protein
MSLNSIKFEPTDIASLYKNSLVEINAKQPVLPNLVSILNRLLPDGNISEKIKRKPLL